MKEDDTAERKKKHERDLQSVPLTSEGRKEEEGMKERNQVFFFMAARSVANRK